MRVLYANIEDVMREAAARWTLVAYFFLSTIFIIIFASAINLDIVNGALAGAKLFGHEVHDVNPGHTIDIEAIVGGFETGFAPALYGFCTFLAIFATAHLVPRMQEKGTIDLYLSRPVGRVKLLMSRYLAGMILAGSNIIYLFGSIWLIVMWKTHVMHPRFFLAGAMALFIIAALLAFAFLIGVFTSSTAVSIMGTYAIFLFSLMLAAHDRLAASLSTEWAAALVNGIYWVLPKTFEIGEAVVAFVSTGRTLPSQISSALSPTPFLTTGAFAIGCLVLASWLFQRKEF
jgi:ABC-type transport system involved in multi-copper enzyme maturation permease subunit